MAYNYGGVQVFTDTQRYPNNPYGDSACSMPLGPMDQPNSATYYVNNKQLFTGPDATVSGANVTSTGGTVTICADYGQPWTGNDSPSSVSQAPSVGMGVFDTDHGTFLGNVQTVTSANAFTLDRSPGNVSGIDLAVSAYGGCGIADYFGGGPGVTSGTPAALYWDNCIWGGRGVTVSGNTFTTQANNVRGCTTFFVGNTDNLCGFQTAEANAPGISPFFAYWGNYETYVAHATGGIGNVWSSNTYTWVRNGGTTAWRFNAGSFANIVPQSTWTGTDGQDAGSTFTTLSSPHCFGLSLKPQLLPGCTGGKKPGGKRDPASRGVCLGIPLSPHRTAARPGGTPPPWIPRQKIPAVTATAGRR